MEHAAHGIARRRVGRFLVTPPEPAQRVERGRFGRAHEIELNDAFDVVITYFRQPMHDGRSFSRRSCAMTTILLERRSMSVALIRPTVIDRRYKAVSLFRH